MSPSAPVEKSVICLLRHGAILAFRHPLAGVQLPKGTREPGETPEDTARRELFEEVGVQAFDTLEPLGTWNCPEPASTWHVFVAQAPDGLPSAWSHAPTGGGPESGLVFEVMWIGLSSASTVLHPLFLPVLGMVQSHLDQVARDRASQS